MISSTLPRQTGLATADPPVFLPFVGANQLFRQAPMMNEPGPEEEAEIVLRPGGVRTASGDAHVLNLPFTAGSLDRGVGTKQ
jgi:hypothetical protein